MAVRIRLKRFGSKKRPFYRLVAATSQVARNGKTLESLGIYDPTKDPKIFEINEDRVQYWLSVGAELTLPVQRLLGNKGVVSKAKRSSSNLGVSRKELKSQESED